jgi:hypothetical protein
MRCTMSVFQIPLGGGVPAPAGQLEVEAPGHDEVLAAARELLAKRYPHVRGVSFTPSGLVAYVEGEASS